MSTHRNQDLKNEVYFVTFTCHEWIPLFEYTKVYDHFIKWFQYLTDRQVKVLGYVIMPNHFHGLLYIENDAFKSINQFIANGKRFLAYEIIARLKAYKAEQLLYRLRCAVPKNEQIKGKKHQVFRSSADMKLCFSRHMVETKLDYIHHNPCVGNWSLAEDWTMYPYSSAGFYMHEEESSFLTHYKEVI